VPKNDENLEVQGQEELENLEGQDQELEQDGNEEEAFDKERALETIRQQRESEKAIAKQLKEAKASLKKYQDDEKKRKDAELSELEKANQRVTELEAALKEAQTMTQALRLRQEFSKVAGKLKLAFVDAQAEEDAFDLSDMDEVVIDGNGKVTGLEEAIKALHKQRPYLFASTDDKGKGTPPRTPNGNKPPTTLNTGTAPVKPRVRL
jgi:DNA repair exonuclease SbcCD ATPase subunit